MTGSDVAVLLLAFLAGTGLAMAGVQIAGPRLRRFLGREQERVGGRLDALFLRRVPARMPVLVRWLAAPGLAVLVALAGEPVLGAVLGVVLFLAPDRLLDHLTERRRDRLGRQVLDLTHALAATTRSGMNLLEALREAAERLPPPMAQELGIALERIEAGATLDAALRDLDRRLDLPGLHLVLRAVLIAEEQGGRLPDLLTKIGRTLQETERVERRIATETSGVRLASRLMAAMPLVIGVLLYFAAPDHVTMLFTTIAGNLILLLSGLLDWIGFTVIKRLGDLEV